MQLQVELGFPTYYSELFAKKNFPQSSILRKKMEADGFNFIEKLSFKNIQILHSDSSISPIIEPRHISLYTHAHTQVVEISPQMSCVYMCINVFVYLSLLELYLP